MKGIRNKQYGLYDIPITTIAPNYVLPSPKGILFTKKLNILSSSTFSQKKVTNTPSTKKTIDNMNSKKFTNILKPIIQKNQQNYIPVTLTPKLNVIIRKTRRKKILLRFYMKQCFQSFHQHGVKQ